MKRPTIKRLREVLAYDPITGILTWRISPTSNVKAGDQAGSRCPRGYINLNVDGCQLMAHRAIFAMVKGRWPKRNVDHEDGDGSNNRWGNLRDAGQSKNIANSKTRKDNTLGLKGVTRHGPGFRARIKVDGRTICLGTFVAPETAHAAYVAKAKEVFGEFARAA